MGEMQRELILANCVGKACNSYGLPIFTTLLQFKNLLNRINKELLIKCLICVFLVLESLSS